MNAVTKSATKALEAALDAATKDTARVADALPYRFVGSIGKLDLVHLLDDQSFGIGFEISVPSVESTPGAHAHVSRVLDQLIRKLPAHYVAQFYRRNSSDVSDFLNLYKQQSGSDEVGQAICEAAVDRWAQAMDDGFFPGDEKNFFPCREEFAVMIKSPATTAFDFDADQAFALLTNLEAPSEKYSAAAETFANAVREIRETALGGDLHLTQMGADAFIPFVVSLLYPMAKSNGNMPHHSGVESVSEAISSAGHIELEDENGDVRLGGFTAVRNGVPSCHRVISMIWQPKAVKPGMCDEMMYKHPHVTFVTTVQMLPQLMESFKLKGAKFLLERTKTGFNAAEANEKIASYDAVTKRLFAGEKICLTRIQAIVSARTDDEADNAALRLQSAMDTMFTAEIEKTFGSSLILPASLPLTADLDRENKFKRQRRMMSLDIADMMPAGGRWTGIVPTPAYLKKETNRRKPIVLYANEVGGPLFINPHQCEENPHVLVAGGSGSGKTFFVHDLLLQTWRIPDVRAYLISIKPDYKRLAHTLGRYLEIDLDQNISLNPLGGAPTNANQAVWTTALSLMVSDGDPHDRPSKDDRVIMEECVMKAARQNWDEQTNTPIKETILSDVIPFLREYGAPGERIANRLKPYYAGPYRNLINRPRSLSKNDRFVFFNLSNVAEMSCCAVMMFSLFRFIDDVMYDKSLVGVTKVCVFDEGWAGMDDPSSAALFTKSARAYRSLGGQAFFISQRFGDYDTDLGQAILANTATKIVLPQQQSELSKLRKYIDLNDLEFAAVSKLRLHKRYYGEFFVKMQGLHSTTGRIIPDALKYAISTTDPADEELYNELLGGAGGDHLAAIERFANDYPFGNARKPAPARAVGRALH